jgi:hypothetical protein
LVSYREAPAYYGVVGEVLEYYGTEAVKRKQVATDMAIAIEQLIAPLKGRDWVTRDDIVKNMQNAVDDYLYAAQDEYGISLNSTDMDEIIDRCLAIAKKLAGR